MNWQTIDTAPKDGTRVLVFDEDDRTWQIAHWQGPETNTPEHWPIGWRMSLFVIPPSSVKRWAPLPPQ